MATTTITNRVISYFFIFDFYYNKDSSDDADYFADSIVYFYPSKDETKKQKLVDCGQIIGLIQYHKYDLFGSVPKEFTYKKSLVTCEHFGRHSVFLILSKDRFATEEANIHLNHILQLFNMLYGTLNQIQSNYPQNNEMQLYLKQTLTPIVEYVFNANRSIRNLFSAIDYAPLKKNNQRCLLHVKHFLSHLQSTYGVQCGFFAYEKRILYSTCDSDTTFYIQVILALERYLPSDEIHILFEPEITLRNGVSLLRIFIRRPPSLQPILNAVNANTDHRIYRRDITSPISIAKSPFSNETDTESFKFSTTSQNYSIPMTNGRRYNSTILEDPAGSSEDTAGFETDRNGDDTSPPSKTETDSIASSITDKKYHPHFPRNGTISTISRPQPLTDDQKYAREIVRTRSGTKDSTIEDSIKQSLGRSGSQDDPDRIVFVRMPSDDDDEDRHSCGDCRPENAICLPPVALNSTLRRPRQRTLTNISDTNDTDNSNNHDHHEGHSKWGDIPEKNDETERDELVLYIQRNSRMLFAGIVDKNLLSEEYLQKLWSLILPGMADLDRDIQVIPVVGETNKTNSDIKFQFNDNTHHVQYEQFWDVNHYHYKIPSSDTACMAFTARSKMQQNPERQMVGFSRGNNLITINRYLPDRVIYYCRRCQEPH